MRINHILFLIALFFLTACNSQSVPDNVIPRDKMVALLVQVHIADGKLTNYSQTPDTLYKYGIANYLKIFKSYNTDTTQFKRSLKFYANKSEIFDKMYDEILKQLNAKVDSINRVRVQIAKRDSIKNAQRTKFLQDSIKKAGAAKKQPGK